MFSKRIEPDPDYEVIEFNQQYSNTSAQQSPKELIFGRFTGLKCDLCGGMNATIKCSECTSQTFCASCDDMFHRHPKRKTHVRKVFADNIPYFTFIHEI